MLLHLLDCTVCHSGQGWPEHPTIMSITAHWDETYHRHYYYNNETGETTWEAPNDGVLEEETATGLDDLFSKIDDAKHELDKLAPKKKRPVREESDSEEEQVEQDVQEDVENDDLPTFEARFDVRSGKFRVTDDKTVDPSSYFAPEVKGTRQMSVYFDVHAYNEQRNQERLLEAGQKKKKPTKKEVQKFKAKKEKKKKEKILADYRDDLDVPE
jgi:hypothetical protein